MRVCVLECPPLGMESHKVEPDQLTASSMSQYNFAPQRARLNIQVHSGTHLEAALTVMESSHYTYAHHYSLAQYDSYLNSFDKQC